MARSPKHLRLCPFGCCGNLVKGRDSRANTGTKRTKRAIKRGDKQRAADEYRPFEGIATIKEIS